MNLDRKNLENLRRSFRIACAMLAISGIAGCTGPESQYFYSHGLQSGVDTLSGPPVSKNTTPYDPAFVCLSNLIQRGKSKEDIRITSGEILDLTGKYIEAEGGSIVTKGASHMVMSALGKLGKSVTLVERVDTAIADRELAYMDKRQLGDGEEHIVPGEEVEVPWLPYFGGTILNSDYYIAGAITEVNFNISSGGAEAVVAGFGAKAKTYTMNIAVDLRLVDTSSLAVVETTSLQKQIVGSEVGADVFRFFDDYLFDLNTGRRTQEPIQFAVRTTIEAAVFEMMSNLLEIDARKCLELVSNGQPLGMLVPDRVDPIVVPPERNSAQKSETF